MDPELPLQPTLNILFFLILLNTEFNERVSSKF